MIAARNGVIISAMIGVSSLLGCTAIVLGSTRQYPEASRFCLSDIACDGAKQGDILPKISFVLTTGTLHDKTQGQFHGMRENRCRVGIRSSVDRASGCGPEGRGFESLRMHHMKKREAIASRFFVSSTSGRWGRPCPTRRGFRPSGSPSW